MASRRLGDLPPALASLVAVLLASEQTLAPRQLATRLGPLRDQLLRATPEINTQQAWNARGEERLPCNRIHERFGSVTSLDARPGAMRFTDARHLCVVRCG
ncbi:hypothetical protein EYF80_051711 [Liparis tanakae]|uniref:Uncharacterized protein n=1 Tax=Liparis tanakae TaxID=230148 RepID=A0A4Z2FB64_9TELE|nr:hypothetical protein EYF80_051711 [Liparis tanakae]